MEKGIVMRMVSSIPIVGTALAIWLEHTQMGMSQHGKFLGLLRGIVTGSVLAVALLVASEISIGIFSVARHWLEINVIAHYKWRINDDATQRAIEEANRPYYERHPDERPRDKHPPIKKEPAWFESTLSAVIGKWEQVTNCPSVVPATACMWKRSNTSQKLAFIVGIHDAVSGDHNRWNELFVRESNFGGIVDNLDAFYANGAHADVPVIDALREVRGR